jgi:hypothetical protein
MLDVTNLLKAKVTAIVRGDAEYLEYWTYPATPAKGVLYVTHENHEFVSGHVRMRGKDEGRYPYHYIEMLDNLFGHEPNTIEVCSGSVTDAAITVDSKDWYLKDESPRICNHYTMDAETLAELPSNKFMRWRCDPPYNEKTAKEMYNTELPNTGKLLTAGARVCKVGSLMFLLLGPQNYQWCPEGVKRIGLIFISVVPNNEVRCLNIYYKEKENQARLQ